MSRFSPRHAFQAVTPCLRKATCFSEVFLLGFFTALPRLQAALRSAKRVAAPSAFARRRHRTRTQRCGLSSCGSGRVSRKERKAVFSVNQCRFKTVPRSLLTYPVPISARGNDERAGLYRHDRWDGGEA